MTLALKQLPPRDSADSLDAQHFSTFTFSTSVDLFAPTTGLDFDPVTSDLAVTHSTRVAVVAPFSGVTRRTITAFRNVAYSATWRSDGKLLACGGLEPIVRVFDVKTKVPLRNFKGHSAAVRVVRFAAHKTVVLSASDDTTVRGWDLATETPVILLRGHSDYVRAASVSADTPDVWVSGSHDGSVRCWDTRIGKCVSLYHSGAPVTSVLGLPGGGCVAVAAGNQLRLWDVVGGRCLLNLSCHSKPISSLVLTQGAQGKPRLISGALDSKLKVLDLVSHQIVHSMDAPGPVTALAASQNGQHLAIGLSNPQVILRRRQVQEFPEEEHEQGAPSGQKRASLEDYEAFLGDFRYQAALNAAIATKNPLVVISLLEELSLRGGVHAALSGHDTMSLLKLLSFVVRTIGNPDYASYMIHVADKLIELYGDQLGTDPALDELFVRLNTKLKEELSVMAKLMEVQGGLEMVARYTSM